VRASTLSKAANSSKNPILCMNYQIRRARSPTVSSLE
jgi:hypothetical protein